MRNTRVLLVSMLMAGLLLLPALGYGQTSYAVSFPHIAFGYANATDFWETHYIIWNTGTTQATVVFHHFSDSGAPLTLSIDGANQTTHTFAIPAGGSIDKQIDVPAWSGTAAVVSGWTAVEPTGSVKGQVIFKQHTTNAGTLRHPEATVPMNNSSPALCIIPFPPPQPSQVNIPFDNTGVKPAKVTSGLAIANTTNAPVVYNMLYVNQAGSTLCTTTLSVPGFGHTALIVTSGAGSCAASDNQKGTVIISGNGLSAVGLRFNFDTSEFTTSLQ